MFSSCKLLSLWLMLLHRYPAKTGNSDSTKPNLSTVVVEDMYRLTLITGCMTVRPKGCVLIEVNRKYSVCLCLNTSKQWFVEKPQKEDPSPKLLCCRSTTDEHVWSKSTKIALQIIWLCCFYITFSYFFQLIYQIFNMFLFYVVVMLYVKCFISQVFTHWPFFFCLVESALETVRSVLKKII